MAVLCALVCPHSSCRRGREEGPATSPGSIGNQQVYAPGTSLLGFEVHFCIFFFLLCERRKRKQTARSLFKLAHSDTLGQILDTHARERPWLKAPEKNQMLPTQRKLT